MDDTQAPAVCLIPGDATMQPIHSTALFAATLAAALSVAPAAHAEPSNEWRVELAGRSTVAGEIEFSLTPEGGKARNVVVPIPAATNHEAAAVMVRNKLSTTFGSDVYRVAVDDIDEVTIRTASGRKDVEVAVVRNTAEGLKVELDRE